MIIQRWKLLSGDFLWALRFSDPRSETRDVTGPSSWTQPSRVLKVFRIVIDSWPSRVQFTNVQKIKRSTQSSQVLCIHDHNLGKLCVKVRQQLTSHHGHNLHAPGWMISLWRVKLTVPWIFLEKLPSIVQEPRKVMGPSRGHVDTFHVFYKFFELR